MKKVNPIRDKSFKFALGVIHLCKKLRRMHEYEIAKQLLKSGTSIGANIEEAMRAHSKKDFAAKFTISHKESSETDFWLRLIIESGTEKEESTGLRKDLDEILRIQTAIIKTVHFRKDV